MKTIRFWAGLLAILLLLIHQSVSAQSLTQTVKGTIIDADSRAPIIGANVYIPGTDPVLGSATDLDGNFKIENVPVGRIDLLITSIGYEERYITNIVVGSAKEVVVNADMRESLMRLTEVIVTDKKHQSELSDEMVLVSGLSVSVDKTKRFAGTINDPARLVTSFAGIQGDPAGSNHIVVRGNSPNTVMWRMEGVEIPNPNHFTEEGESGGAINILNSNMLANSDFYTGAFTADFGNVLGSVFDMKMRTGNNEKREYSIGVGILGTDITLEGPFKNGGRSSYLANYRYSTLAILDDLGIVDFGGVPKYQDLSFKVSMPTEKAGLFTVFGIGGKSSIDEDYFDENTEELEGAESFRSAMGTVNLNHAYFINSNTSFDSYVGLSYNGSDYFYDELNEVSQSMERDYYDKLEKYSWRAGTVFNTKINARHVLRAGVNHQQFHFNFFQEYLDDDDNLTTGLSDEGNAGILRVFGSWKFRVTDDLTITSGLNYQAFSLNGEKLIEPRFSFKYRLNEQQSIFGGFGMHSQMSPLPVYFSVVEGMDGRPNKSLDFMKARHFVIGYDWVLSKNLYFKAETFYQQLYDIPVENNIASSYSLINSVNGFTDKELVNKGTGVNYGLELTLERYFQNQYYFLVTGSLYESNYKALDGITRDTRFNGGHAVNVLFGKEFYLRGNQNRIFNISTRVTTTGGFRFTPLLLDESIEKGEGIYDYANRYGVPGDQFFKWDISMSYQWNRTKTRQEIKLEVQNLTNNQAKTSEYYNSDAQALEMEYQLPLFPVITYTIEF